MTGELAGNSEGLIVISPAIEHGHVQVSIGYGEEKPELTGALNFRTQEIEIEATSRTVAITVSAFQTEWMELPEDWGEGPRVMVHIAEWSQPGTPPSDAEYRIWIDQI